MTKEQKTACLTVIAFMKAVEEVENNFFSKGAGYMRELLEGAMQEEERTRPGYRLEKGHDKN